MEMSYSVLQALGNNVQTLLTWDGSLAYTFTLESQKVCYEMLIYGRSF